LFVLLHPKPYTFFLFCGGYNDFQVWAWLAPLVYALHVMEEHTFNWRDSAARSGA
jgi:hypothetical protein